MSNTKSQQLLGDSTEEEKDDEFQSVQWIKIYNEDDISQPLEIFYGHGKDSSIYWKTVEIAGCPTHKFYYYPSVLKCSKELNFDGGNIINIYDYDEIGNIISPSIYAFAENTSLSEDQLIMFNSMNEAVITMKNTTSKDGFQFKIPAGRYIVKLLHGNKDYIDRLTVELNGEPVKAIYQQYDESEDGYDFHEFETTYLYFEIKDKDEPDVVTVQIQRKPEFADDDMIFSLGDPFKYSLPEGISEATYKKIFTLINKLDTQHLFNYEYQPDEEKMIEDPLSAISFFQSNHIYFERVISQLDTSEKTSLNLLAKSKT